MEDFTAFTHGERAVLEALNRHGVRFMLVGLSAAVLQGANAGTRDIDKRAAGRNKDLAVIPALEEALAAVRSSG